MPRHRGRRGRRAADVRTLTRHTYTHGTHTSDTRAVCSSPAQLTKPPVPHLPTDSTHTGAAPSPMARHRGGRAPRDGQGVPPRRTADRQRGNRQDRQRRGQGTDVNRRYKNKSIRGQGREGTQQSKQTRADIVRQAAPPTTAGLSAQAKHFIKKKKTQNSGCKKTKKRIPTCSANTKPKGVHTFLSNTAAAWLNIANRDSRLWLRLGFEGGDVGETAVTSSGSKPTTSLYAQTDTPNKNIIVIAAYEIL